MKALITLVIFMCLLSVSSEASSIVVTTKSHGSIEFSEEAHAFYRKHSRLRRATDYLLRNRKCEPSARDLSSNVAVHYSYACVVEIKKQSVIIYAANQRTKTGINFQIALLDEAALNKIRERTEYQMLIKQRPPPTGGGPRDFPRAPEIHFWYRLTLLDIQDPENLGLASVDLAEFDKTMDELDAPIHQLR